MRQKHVAVALTAFFCALLGVFTLTKYGVQVNNAAPAEAQSYNHPLSYNQIGESMEWQHPTPIVAEQVKSSIVNQLNAFKKNDYIKAAAYQSVRLRQNLGCPDRFRAMISSEYPEFANYKAVKFTSIVISSCGEAAQASVKLTGMDGKQVTAVYLMIREDNTFRIASVEGGVDRCRPVPVPMANVVGPKFS